MIFSNALLPSVLTKIFIFANTNRRKMHCPSGKFFPMQKTSHTLVMIKNHSPGMKKEKSACSKAASKALEVNGNTVGLSHFRALSSGKSNYFIFQSQHLRGSRLFHQEIPLESGNQYKSFESRMLFWYSVHGSYAYRSLCACKQHSFQPNVGKSRLYQRRNAPQAV